MSPPAASKSPGKVTASNHRKSTDGSTPACIVCSAPSRASSVYCSDQCILKHAQGVEKVSVISIIVEFLKYLEW